MQPSHTRDWFKRYYFYVDIWCILATVNIVTIILMSLVRYYLNKLYPDLASSKRNNVSSNILEFDIEKVINNDSTLDDPM